MERETGFEPATSSLGKVGWTCLQQLSVSGALYRLTASLAKSAFSSLTPSNRGFFEVQSHCHSYLDLRGIPWQSQPGLHRPGRQPWESTLPRSFSPPADRRRSSGMASAAEILQFEHADLLISKQKLERARGIEVVRIKREQRTQDLCFSSRPFVLCGLPVRRLPKDQLLYERRNGKFVLQITGHPEFGVPFGQDRLVPIFLATLAVQQKSQTIRFRTAAEMLESFGMHTGGKEYRRLVGAFERIFGATIFFGTDSFSGKATMIQLILFALAFRITSCSFIILSETGILCPGSTSQLRPPQTRTGQPTYQYDRTTHTLTTAGRRRTAGRVAVMIISAHAVAVVARRTTSAVCPSVRAHGDFPPPVEFVLVHSGAKLVGARVYIR